MKNIILLILVSFFSLNTLAQEEERMDEKENMEDAPKGGFKKDHLFTGGGIQLSLSNSTFVVGASPVLGYSINKWLDAGIVLNFTYLSDRHITYYYPNTLQYFSSDDKLHQTDFGPGAFVKFYPLKFLFVQAQGEVNFVSQKIIYADNQPNEKTNYTAPSLLVGAGYCSGRQGVGDLFYYLSLSVDVLRDRNSPYVEQISNGKVNALPIIRAGLQIPLFQGNRRKD